MNVVDIPMGTAVVMAVGIASVAYVARNEFVGGIIGSVMIGSLIAELLTGTFK